MFNTPEQKLCHRPTHTSIGWQILVSAVLYASNGHRLLQNISSHHYLIMTGHDLVDIQMISKVFDTWMWKSSSVRRASISAKLQQHCITV